MFVFKRVLLLHVAQILEDSAAGNECIPHVQGNFFSSLNYNY